MRVAIVAQRLLRYLSVSLGFNDWAMLIVSASTPDVERAGDEIRYSLFVKNPEWQAIPSATKLFSPCTNNF